MSKSNMIWITWEVQRRSLELARVLNCNLYLFEFAGTLRYPKCIYHTLKVLFSTPNKIVFVQNPSMILAATACLFGLLFNRKIIVDRHSTFRLNEKRKPTLDWMVFDILNKFTIKMADLTIVTNEYLAKIIEGLNGKACVLPDKLPDMVQTKKIELGKSFNVFLISSFGKDEPIAATIRAADRLREYGVKLYVSGNTKKLRHSAKLEAHPNVTFTGYLSEEAFVNYVFSSDAVMVLTTADYCMLCGCYESVAAQKPLITSDKQVLRAYFTGSVFVDNTSEGISYGIKELMFDYDIYLHNTFTLKKKIDTEWPERYKRLQKWLTQNENEIF